MRYWGTEYDLQRVEGRLNALPQFLTEIDDLDIHFIHIKSRHENVLPVILIPSLAGFGRRDADRRRPAHRSAGTRR